jgi:hypothetical protein
MLKIIHESKKDLESHLLEAMRNEYHKKIEILETEIYSLGNERAHKMSQQQDSSSRSKIEDGYKKKMKELEDKLKEFKRKNKEQEEKRRELE